MKKIIFFFIPSFLNNAGHESAFISPLLKISKKKKLSYYFLTQKKNKLKNNNYNVFYKSSFIILKILDIFRNYFIFTEILKNFKNKKLTIYIDGFSLYDLFCMLLVSISNNIKLILYVRHKYKNILKKILFKYFINKFQKTNNKIIFLTDTSIMKKYLKKLKIKTFLLPIPHTIRRNSLQKIILNKKKINIWCPGPIRKEKYGQNLENFLKKNDKSNFIFNVNNNYLINQKLKEIRFCKLNSNLTRSQYEQQFFNNDIIILPYNSKNYEEKTSGIFVESISAFKITLVSDKTWMSSELKNFKLEKLVVKDWNNFNLYNFINKLDIKYVKKRLLLMRNNYLKFHNEKNFINILSYAFK